jgi:hypothetical protein
MQNVFIFLFLVSYLVLLSYFLSETALFCVKFTLVFRIVHQLIPSDYRVIHERGISVFLFTATHYTQQYLDLKF